MRIRSMLGLLLAAVSAALADPASASSGALDAEGCHKDPKSEVRHCHVSANEKLASASTAVIDIETSARDAKNGDDLYLACR